MVSGWIKLVDNIVNEGPKIVWIIESCIEKLVGICCQVDDAYLCKKNIKDVKISGLAWMKETVRHKSCVPVVKSDSEIAEPLSEPIADDEVFSILDDAVDEVTKAANPSELRLPAVGDSSIVSSSGGYKSFNLGVAFETWKKQLKLRGGNQLSPFCGGSGGNMGTKPNCSCWGQVGQSLPHASSKGDFVKALEVRTWASHRTVRNIDLEGKWVGTEANVG